MADRPHYIDLLGLTRQVKLAEQYADELGLEGKRIRTEDGRLKLLSQLREGAGVNVYTGPLGAPFWSLASIEVKVRVEPDGTEYNFRTKDTRLWSLMSGGLTVAKARALLKGFPTGSAPTPKHSQYGRWVAADALRTRLDALAGTASAVPIVVEAFAVEVVREAADQLRLVGNIEEFSALDWEWEVSTLNPVGLSVSTGERNYYLPVRASDLNHGSGHGEALKGLLGKRLAAGLPAVFHNGRADLGTQHPGDPVALSGRELDDTLILGYLAGEKDLRLKPMTRSYFPDRDPMDYPIDENGVGLEALPVDLAARYAAAGDTRNTYDLYFKLLKKVEDRGMLPMYKAFERPLMPVIASMEKYGSPVDMDEVLRLREQHWQAEEAIRQRVLAASGFDLDDDEQTKLYIKSKTGYYPGSIDKRTLSKYQGEWMDEIIHPEFGYRPYRTRRRNFLDRSIARWEELGRPDDFRVYSNFVQAGGVLDNDPRGFKSAPRTGRLSSSGSKRPWDRAYGAPNLTNQPRLIRSAFIPPKGGRYVYWSLDYGGLELHIAASVSQDPVMLEVLRQICPVAPLPCPHTPKCGDLHDSFLFEIVQRTGKNPGRPATKQGNFEQLYGGGIAKLVQILAIQRIYIAYEMAKIIVDLHKERHAVYHSYGDEVIEKARRNGGYAESLFGRRRYEEDLFSNDPETREWAQRALVNMTIQGTAADIVKQAMVWAVPVLLHFGAHLSIQVHDEICGWVEREKADAFMGAMRAVMVSVPLPGLQLKVEGGWGANWGEVH